METAEKISITITAEQARMIREQVASGAYASTSEVVRAGLRFLERDETEHRERLNAIRRRIDAAVNDPRPDVPMDEAFARIRSHIADRDDGAQ